MEVPCSQGHSGESCHIYAPRLAFVTVLGGQLQFGVRWASPGHGRSAHGLELTVRDLYEASAQCWKNAETVLHSALSKIWAVFSAWHWCLRDDPAQLPQSCINWGLLRWYYGHSSGPQLSAWDLMRFVGCFRLNSPLGRRGYRKTQAACVYLLPMKLEMGSHGICEPLQFFGFNFSSLHDP